MSCSAELPTKCEGRAETFSDMQSLRKFIFHESCFRKILEYARHLVNKKKNVQEPGANPGEKSRMSAVPPGGRGTGVPGKKGHEQIP